MPAFLTPEKLVERWGGSVSVRSLANWRSLGRGPRFTKLGGRVTYALEEVIAYEQSRTVQWTGQCGSDEFDTTD